MTRAAAFTVVFFFVAPGSAAGLVPWLITGWERPDVGVGILDVLGAVLVVLGLVAVIACFVRFVTEGAGTPAPVAPTETLVVGGLYRHVRNPMYVAVSSVIAGESLLLRSPGWPSGCWSSWRRRWRSCAATRNRPCAGGSERRTSGTARPFPGGGPGSRRTGADLAQNRYCRPLVSRTL